MSLPDIKIPRCLSINPKCTILAEFIHDLCKLKFSGEGEPSFHANVHQFITFCKHHKIKSRDVWVILLTLTFEGHAQCWCHTLPFSFIDSFGQLVEMMTKMFKEYSHRYFHEEICRLSMEPYKPIEDFANHFLHLYYEIP